MMAEASEQAAALEKMLGEWKMRKLLSKIKLMLTKKTIATMMDQLKVKFHKTNSN